MTRELFSPGDRLGDYEILGRLRAGGMATLFLGRRHGAAGVSRPVVIKVIHPHLAEDELIVKMFIDEARISSHISHSNVVYVEKFGEHDGVYYIAMEYVDGCSLEQALRTLARDQAQLAPELAVHIVLEAAAGLHAAHETTDDDGVPLGIVHRDVSPSNVLLTRDGRIKVIDFGIAKARGRLGATKTGASLKGKLRYMSPEQAWGRDTDRRTDVYALGIVLWELLTSRQLFRGGDDMAVLEQVRHPEIPPAGTLNPGVTLALDEVIARATAKELDARLTTALELRRELMRAVPAALATPADVIAQLVGKVRAALGPAIPAIPELDHKATTPSRRSGAARVVPASPASAPAIDEAYTTQLSPMGSESAVRGAAGEVQPVATRSSRKAVAVAGLAVAAAAVIAIVAFASRGGDGEAPASVAPPSAAPTVKMTTTTIPAAAPATADQATPSTGTAGQPSTAAGATAGTAGQPSTAAGATAGNAPTTATPADKTTATVTPTVDKTAPAGATAAPALDKTTATVAPTVDKTAPAGATAAPTVNHAGTAGKATPTTATAKKQPPPRRVARPKDPSIKAVDVDGTMLADEPPATPAPKKPPADTVRVDGTELAK